MQALSIAAAGMTAAAERFADSARRTAEAPFADPAGEALERGAAKAAMAANGRVARAAIRMTSALLDVLA